MESFQQQGQKKFSSSEEEVVFLRKQIADRERALLDRSSETDSTDYETLGKQELKEYSQHTPEVILKKKHRLEGVDLAKATEQVKISSEAVADVLKIAYQEGIRNALTVLEKTGDAYLTDEVHKALIRDIKEGRQIAGFKEDVPPWQVLHMTLLEVSLPEHAEGNNETQLLILMSAMEQFYAGMQSIGQTGKPLHYSLEIAVADNSDHIVFYVSIPTQHVDLFEKQILSLFPHAVLTEQQNDYNIFTEGNVTGISVAKLKKHPIYPLRLYESFENDPLNVLLNTFSKIDREGSGAAIQLTIQVGGSSYQDLYKNIIKRIQKGESPSVAIRKSTFGGEMFEFAKGMVFSSPDSKEADHAGVQDSYTDEIDNFTQKIQTPILNTNIRIAVSASSEERVSQILGEIEAGFHQFENTQNNKFYFVRKKDKALAIEEKAFSFRQFSKKHTLPLSLRELATVMHFPSEGIDSTPQFKQSRAKTAAAPIDLPASGTLLGINEFRRRETEIFITPEDRMRHFYILGQTGTGKTTLMKNMINQDIRDGNGVCFIDPHGTDVLDVLAAVPPERKDDVIYFDPAKTDMVMGLNMLEYDINRPEQKTFVVNELFSIFQKLYGSNPESMGPMFEQYFRNATQLVLDDPESGNTLMDVSRVMVDAEFRKLKLSRATNPVVKQFWTEIAEKADGEASLANIVPYITSKFDVFTADDFMRPIIGQQKSSFNFREIMDTKKILLVNLSKGRLGEINANLIGMIIVGKLLMAALSRVDDPTQSFPPFYLHMDEFQNISTDAVSSILSEARKYKLGLTVAHQFIAQLDKNIKDAVFGNVGSLAIFRTGPEDAEFLSQQFEPTFDANDIMNIENRNAIARILSHGTPTNPFTIRTMTPPKTDASVLQELMDYSYQKYAQPRRMVEMEISSRYQ